MAIIPADEKVFMVDKRTNTTYGGSQALQDMQQWYTMQDISDSVVVAAPYQSYVALFTQSGTNAPVVTIVSNTLGLNITWVRNATGQYYAGDISSKCPDAKTVYIVSDASNGINLYGVPLKEAHLWTYGNDTPQTGRYLNLSMTTVSNAGDIEFADWDSPKVILLEIRVYN